MSRLSDAYRVAIINEIKSQNLYAMLAIASEDKESKMIFENLEKFEKIHEEKISKIFFEKFPGEELKLDYSALPKLKSQIESKNQKQIYEFAIKKEVDANEAYLKLSELSEEQELKDFFAELAAEENKHVEILENEILRLQGSLVWFNETDLEKLLDY